jgi:hypothetical protein
MDRRFVSQGDDGEPVAVVDVGEVIPTPAGRVRFGPEEAKWRDSSERRSCNSIKSSTSVARKGRNRTSRPSRSVSPSAGHAADVGRCRRRVGVIGLPCPSGAPQVGHDPTAVGFWTPLPLASGRWRSGHPLALGTPRVASVDREDVPEWGLPSSPALIMPRMRLIHHPCRSLAMSRAMFVAPRTLDVLTKTSGDPPVVRPRLSTDLPTGGVIAYFGSASATNTSPARHGGSSRRRIAHAVLIRHREAAGSRHARPPPARPAELLSQARDSPRAS